MGWKIFMDINADMFRSGSLFLFVTANNWMVNVAQRHHLGVDPCA